MNNLQTYKYFQVWTIETIVTFEIKIHVSWLKFLYIL